MPSKKAKKVTKNVKASKTMNKPSVKVSKLSKTIAKFGRKKLIALSALITLMVFVFMASLMGISNLMASTDETAVLGASTPGTPTKFSLVTYNSSSGYATVSWKTGPLNDGADEHEIVVAQENCTFPIATTTVVQTDEGSKGNYTRKKSLFSIAHQTSVWGFTVRKECSNIKQSFRIKIRAVKIKNGIKTYSSYAEISGVK